LLIEELKGSSASIFNQQSKINNQQLPSSVAPPRFATQLLGYTLERGTVERTGCSGASTYLSANFAAS